MKIKRGEVVTMKAETIDDLPNMKETEPRVDFHITIPITLYNKLLESSRKTGYNKSDLIRHAVKAYLK